MALGPRALHTLILFFHNFHGMPKILRRIIITGLCLIPFIPLVVSPGTLFPWSFFFPFITGKNFLFRIIVSLVFGAWLWLAYLDPQARPKKNGLLTAVSLFLVVQIAATFLGENPSRSFWSNFERMEGLLSYLYLYLYFLVLVSFVRTEQLWRRLFQTTVGVSALVSLHGIIQLFGGAAIHQSGSRLDASLGNSAYLAVYVLFHIFLLGYLYVTTDRKEQWLKGIYAILAAIEVVVLYHTATRGAILGFLGGSALVLLLIGLLKGGRLRKVSLSLLGALILAVLIFIGVRHTAPIQNNPILSRFASISLNDGTTQSRFLIWHMSWEGFKEHPVLGWGPENYSLVFQKYYSPEMYGNEPWFDRSHNIVFDTLINYGLIGLLVYVSIFILALYYLWRGKVGNSDQALFVRSLFTGLLAAYFLQNVFVFDNITSYILFYTVLAYLSFAFSQSKKGEVGADTTVVKNNKRVAHGDDGWEIIIGLVSIAIALGSAYYFSLRSMTVSATLIDAITPSHGAAETSEQSALRRLADFQAIFARRHAVGLGEAREQLLQAASAILNDQNISPTTKASFRDLVTMTVSDYLATKPDDARFLMLYGSYLLNTSRVAEAITTLEEARTLSPQKQIILFQLGSAYLSIGQTEKALAILKGAYELEPKFTEARKIYALALLLSNQEEKANQVMGAEKNSFITDDRFLSYYARTHRYNELIAAWSLRVQANPNDQNAVLSLAGSYYYAGNRSQAIKTLQDYVGRNSAFATQAGDIIAQIKAGTIGNPQ